MATHGRRSNTRVTRTLRFFYRTILEKPEKFPRHRQYFRASAKYFPNACPRRPRKKRKKKTRKKKTPHRDDNKHPSQRSEESATGATQRNATQRHATQLNATQLNATLRNATQRKRKPTIFVVPDIFLHASKLDFFSDAEWTASPSRIYKRRVKQFSAWIYWKTGEWGKR